jgi:hypothetical protein
MDQICPGIYLTRSDGTTQSIDEYVKEISRLHGRSQRISEKSMSLEDFAAKMKEQDYKCAICQKPFARKKVGKYSKKNDIYIDHDHQIHGLVRGLLCSKCACATESLLDNPGLMIKAALYIFQHNASRGIVDHRELALSREILKFIEAAK